MSSGPIPDLSHASGSSRERTAIVAEHIVCFYDRDADLLDRLQKYVGDAMKDGGSALVIGTPAHTHALEQRLCGSNVNLARAILEDRYIRFDAETTLARFMVRGWPDRALLRELLARPLRRAAAHGRRIFAFGEMVSLLCDRGEVAAAIDLERMWNDMLLEHPISLLCAYRKSALGNDFASAAAAIGACHSHVSGLDDRRAA